MTRTGGDVTTTREWGGFVLASIMTCGLAAVVLLAIAPRIGVPLEKAASIATDLLPLSIGLVLLSGFAIFCAVAPVTLACHFVRGRSLLIHLLIGPLVAIGAVLISSLLKGRGLSVGSYETLIWMLSAVAGAGVYYAIVERGGTLR